MGYGTHTIKERDYMMITMLLAALRAIFIKLIAAVATEKMVEWLLFWAAEIVVKSTKTNKDDEFLNKLRFTYYEPKE